MCKKIFPTKLYIGQNSSLYNMYLEDMVCLGKNLKAILPITSMFPISFKLTQNVNGHEINDMLNILVTKSGENSN